MSMTFQELTSGDDAAEDRWLNRDEQRVWGAFSAATRLLLDRLDRDLQHDGGMPHSYYIVLAVLADAPDERLRMSDLARRTLSSSSRLSHAVRRLEMMGWVRRERCAGDRRGALAVLTDAGYAALQRAAPGHVASVRAHFFDALTPAQLDQLRYISETLAQHLGSDKRRTGRAREKKNSSTALE
jgi:DNA-binding MarR family transcriptional regulator